MVFGWIESNLNVMLKYVHFTELENINFKKKISIDFTFLQYANEDQAFETRQALHGVSWPLSNPKKLIVEYATKEDMESAREISKDQPPARKTEPLVSNDLWQQDHWSRDERPTVVNKV